jgi:hypothetical protein
MAQKREITSDSSATSTTTTPAVDTIKSPKHHRGSTLTGNTLHFTRKSISPVGIAPLSPPDFIEQTRLAIISTIQTLIPKDKQLSCSSVFLTDSWIASWKGSSGDFLL